MARVKTSTQERQPRLDIESAKPLPKAAREFVDAAKRIIAREGLEAVTLRRVADEVGANKASIWYHFGGKDGLIEAVIHDYQLENNVFTEPEIGPGASVEERVDSLIRQWRSVLCDPFSYAGSADVLAYSLHDELLLAQWRRTYKAWLEDVQNRLGLPEGSQEARHIVEVIVAICDGLTVQQALGFVESDPERLEPFLESVRSCIIAIMRQFIPIIESESAMAHV